MSYIIDNWFECENPKIVRNRYTCELIHVPCGECTACKVKKMRRWVAPLNYECQRWKYIFFVTLTYNDRFLPKINLEFYRNELTNKDQEKFDELCKQSEDFINYYNGSIPCFSSRDIQNFIKRFRESVFRSCGFRENVRYFFSSDYGSTLFRPHWHGLIFSNSDYIATNITTLVSKSWSLYSKTRCKRYSFGITEQEFAISAGKYVSAYIQAIDRLPAIYQFKGLKPKSFHSSNPSIGSLYRCVEIDKEIIFRGLTEVTIYDPISFQWKKTPLLPNIVRRLFPAIPSFSSLSRNERFSVYRACYDVCDLLPKERRLAFRNKCYVNSFLNDYVSLNEPDDLSVDYSQRMLDKCDRIFYAWQRLYFVSKKYSLSVYEYDELIEKYYFNRAMQSLKKQFEYENRFLLKYPNRLKDLPYIIDRALINNQRGISSIKGIDICDAPKPLDVDRDYFLLSKILYNKCVKRKCDNAYLELHPEFKQFHK